MYLSLVRINDKLFRLRACSHPKKKHRRKLQKEVSQGRVFAISVTLFVPTGQFKAGLYYNNQCQWHCASFILTKFTLG